MVALKWYIRCFDESGEEKYHYGPFKSVHEADAYAVKTKLKDWDKLSEIA